MMLTGVTRRRFSVTHMWFPATRRHLLVTPLERKKSGKVYVLYSS